MDVVLQKVIPRYSQKSDGFSIVKSKIQYTGNGIYLVIPVGLA